MDFMIKTLSYEKREEIIIERDKHTY